METQTIIETTVKEKKNRTRPTENEPTNSLKPSAAFIGASWFALVAGSIAFCVGLWRAEMSLNEKGYYFTVLMFGLFSVISVQKSVRDRLEGIKVSDLYYGLSWFCAVGSMLLLLIGLWNASLTLSEKGFYGMSFLLSLFSAIAVQKNTRDKMQLQQIEEM